jgi:hypothetical protein
MAVKTIRIAPANSFVLVSDSRGGSVPDPNEIAHDANITATESCVVVCCLPEVDGETEITLGRAYAVDPGSSPSFDGVIPTPSGNVTVFTVEWKPVLQTDVSTMNTRVRIWKNRQRFADEIVIGVE